MSVERGTKGLLGLINSKNRDDSPKAISDHLVPIVDCKPFLLMGASAYVSNAGIAVAAARGQSVKIIASDPIQVPPGFLRYFDYFSAELVATGALTIGQIDSIIHFRASGGSWFTNVMLGNGRGNNPVSNSAVPGSTGATERQVLTANDFWLEAGDTLGAMVSTIGGDSQVNFYWRSFDIPQN